MIFYQIIYNFHKNVFFNVKLLFKNLFFIKNINIFMQNFIKPLELLDFL